MLPPPHTLLPELISLWKETSISHTTTAKTVHKVGTGGLPESDGAFYL